MTAINYPSTLPLPLAGEFSESVLESKVQDAGEVGAARRRNRFTRLLNRWKFTLYLIEADKAALYTFYDTTLERGVESFNWTHPTTGVTYEVIMPGRPTADHFDGELWALKVELEEI
jgi:hypothetical protein